MSRIARLRVTGIVVGISTATWLTLLGQWVENHQRSVPFGLAFPLWVLWRLVLVAPAQLLAYVVGWHWGNDGALNSAELATVLIVNIGLWALAGMTPACILKSGRAARFGSRMFLMVGAVALLVGCIIGDGLWLRIIGSSVLVIGGVIPAIYSMWFRTPTVQMITPPNP